MTFKKVLASITPVKKGYQLLSYARYVGGMRVTSYSRNEYDYIASNPAQKLWHDAYEKVYCKEHKTYELVPYANYYQGFLKIWYESGIHPRFSLFEEFSKQHPKMPISWFTRVFFGTTNHWGKMTSATTKIIIKYKDDKKGLIKWMNEELHAMTPVRLMAGGRSWTVSRDFKKRFKDKDFKLTEFLKESNQSLRRLMLLSRAFTIENVVQKMTTIAKDDEGEILVDSVPANRWSTIQQLYLHVICPTTHEHYLLGIPQKLLCLHGHVGFREPRWNAAIRHPTGAVCEQIVPETGWTPSSARRWTFGLDDDAEFLVEA